MVELCVGICTVSSRRINYLPQTLDSMFNNYGGAFGDSMEVRVYNCDLKGVEVDVLEGREDLKSKVKIVRINNHPSFDKLPLYFGDDEVRVYWRVKQCFDASEAFRRSYGVGKMYLHLEDDVIMGRSWDKYILREMQFQPNWRVMHLAQGGLIGWLFKNEDLLKVASLFRAFREDLPVDWLVRYFVQIVIHTGQLFVHTPYSIVQHIGEERTLRGHGEQMVKFDNFIGEGKKWKLE